jgi:hypothetical protein
MFPLDMPVIHGSNRSRWCVRTWCIPRRSVRRNSVMATEMVPAPVPEPEPVLVLVLVPVLVPASCHKSRPTRPTDRTKIRRSTRDQ